jgi:hypothetical protein
LKPTAALAFMESSCLNRTTHLVSSEDAMQSDASCFTTPTERARIGGRMWLIPVVYRLHLPSPIPNVTQKGSQATGPPEKPSTLLYELPISTML